MTTYKFKQETSPDVFEEGTVEAANEEEAKAKLRGEHGGVTVMLTGDDGDSDNGQDDDSDDSSSEDEDGSGKDD